MTNKSLDDGECKFDDGACKIYMKEGHEGTEVKEIMKKMLNLVIEFGIEFPSEVHVESGGTLDAQEILKKIIYFADRAVKYRDPAIGHLVHLAYLDSLW